MCVRLGMLGGRRRRRGFAVWPPSGTWKAGADGRAWAVLLGGRRGRDFAVRRQAHPPELWRFAAAAAAGTAAAARPMVAIDGPSFQV